MTSKPGQQTDLFGNPVTTLPRSSGRGRADSNDIDLMHTIAGNAVRCGYLLVGAGERVYTRTDHHHEVARVPQYEDDAVHQLLRRHWLTRGTQHRISCGAASLLGTAMLVPKTTREQITRWERLQRPSSWPTTIHQPRQPAAGGSNGSRGGSGGGGVVNLDQHRRRRRP
jgi:hypothetical protein